MLLWIHVQYVILQVAPGNNVVLMTLEGTSPELKSVLLNSHYDVVPVFPVSASLSLPLSFHCYVSPPPFFSCINSSSVRSTGRLIHSQLTSMKMEISMPEALRYIQSPKICSASAILLETGSQWDKCCAILCVYASDWSPYATHCTLYSVVTDCCALSTGHEVCDSLASWGCEEAEERWLQIPSYNIPDHGTRWVCVAHVHTYRKHQLLGACTYRCKP